MGEPSGVVTNNKQNTSGTGSLTLLIVNHLTLVYRSVSTVSCMDHIVRFEGWMSASKCSLVISALDNITMSS